MFAVFLLLPILAQGPERAAALLEPVRPILEEVLGERLPNPLPFRTVRAGELPDCRDAEMEAAIRFNWPEVWRSEVEWVAWLQRKTDFLTGWGQDRKELEALRSQAYSALRPFWVAYHPQGSNVILLPDNTLDLVDWVKKQCPERTDQQEFIRRFVQLAIVHEVVRFALDRRYAVGRRFAECKDLEDNRALQAVVEGRAFFLTRQVARRLGTDEVFPLLLARFTEVQPDFDYSTCSAPWRNAETHRRKGIFYIALALTYYRAGTLGLAFFDFADAQRIPDAEKRVFTHPPAQLSLLQQPEFYWQAEAPLRPGLEGRLARQAKTLPRWQWDWAPQPWTPDMVREVAELLGARERAEKCLAGWREAGSVVWHGKRNPRAEIAVGAVRLADARAAGAYYGLSIDMERERDKLLNSTPGAVQRVIQSKSESIAFPGAEDAVRTEKVFQTVGAKEPPIAVTTLLLRAGDLVVLFTWRDGPVDPDWASKLLAGIAAETLRPGGN